MRVTHLVLLSGWAINAIFKEPIGKEKQPNNYGSHSLIPFIQQTYVKYHVPDTVLSAKK